MGVEEPKNDNAGEDEDRSRWSSRLAFYMAAVGSAVGFGNVWRFPQLAADYGGGAFFIPYLLALFVIGIPILFLEIAMGQFHQTGDIGVFGSIHPRLRGVGLSSVACAYMLVCYYAMLIAWVVNAFFDSFGKNSIWTQNPTGGESVTHFVVSVTGAGTVGDDQNATRLVGANVGYSALTWFIIYLCVAFGIKWTGRITYFTMGLPIVLLFVFLGRALSLPGSEDGVKKYIGQWDMSVLVDRPDVWSRAVSQIFFSLSVTFGVMTAYGSHCKRTEPALLNSTVIAISNSLFSFVAGFAVFAAVGHAAHLSEDGEWPSYSTFSLVFGTWPVVLNTLPGGIHWVRLLFVNLFLLGIDSAFSMLEGLLTVVLDTVRFQNAKRWVVAGIAALLAWVIGFIYATDAGINWLDTIDYYINFVLLLVGFFESFSVGWIFGIEKSIENLGAPAVLFFMFGNFGSVVLACGLWFGLETNEVLFGFIGLIVFYLLFLGISLFLVKKEVPEEGEWWIKPILYELYFRNVMDLKAELQPVIGWCPALWGVMMRHLIPHILLICFVNMARAEQDNPDQQYYGKSMFGHYGGYNFLPYQLLGILCVVFVLFLFLIGVAAPNTMAWLDLPDEKKKWSQGVQAKIVFEADPEEANYEYEAAKENEGMNENENSSRFEASC